MGGNIWSKETRRVTKQEVLDTVCWLETVLGVFLLPNMLGSTGLTDVSGDIDLGMDIHQFPKVLLWEKLNRWIWDTNAFPKTEEWIKKTGICVHFKCPISGRSSNGFVQVDFMFGENLEWMKFVYRSNIPPGSPYKGFHRHILMSSIVKAINPEWKWNQQVGLVERHKPTDLIISNNPDEIAKILLGENAKVSDLDNVESIMKALENDPDKAAKIKDFEDNIAKHPLK